MRLTAVKFKIWTGAIGLVLTLPLSFASAAESSRAAPPAATLAEFAQSASVLDAWRDYAMADLTAGFSWALDRTAIAGAPTLFDRGNAHFSPSAAHFAGMSIDPVPLRINFLKTKAADTPLFVPADAPGLIQDFSPGLQRYIVAPSYSQRWGENSAISVSAIFAYQRFASIGMGQDSVSVNGNSGSLLASSSVWRDNPGSYGSGMRLEFNTALSDRLSWQVGVQSRVNMDTFNNYRGVYSEPGSFDIPASANVGFGYALTPRLKLDMGLEHVVYSQIAPFTSSALPTRFLVLLGSEVSPAFEWQDLSVYSLGWTWRDPSEGVWSLHYSTREQPLPTSQLLQSALEPYLGSYDIEAAFAHMFGRDSSLRMAATYAPTQFVLGLPTSNSLRNGNSGNQIEYEAVWTTRF